MALRPKPSIQTKKGGDPSKPASRTGIPSKDLVPISEILPPQLSLIPVSHSTLFPGMVVPLILPQGKLSKTADQALESGSYVGIVVSSDPSNLNLGTSPTHSVSGLLQENQVPENPAPSAKVEKFYPFGVAGKILKKINLPDNQVSVLVSGLQRFRIQSVLCEEPTIKAQVEYLYETTQKGTELEALMRSALSQFKQISKDNPLISEEVKVALVNIDGPGKLADFMASVLIRDVNEYQEFLAISEVRARFHRLLLLLRKEHEVQAVQRKISDEINQKVSSAQREFYLQEQLKTIQKELGKESDERSRLITKFRDRLKDKKISEETLKKIEEEFEKLSQLNDQSSEFSVTVNYIDWMTSLPWGLRSKEHHDLRSAKKTLDHDHYGLKTVKERILEFIAVRKLKGTSEGSIICFVGPPGTGKTSLGKSVAKTLNRKFFRFSVGGMRDEAEIKGHRRTYVGALPGKIIQGLKRVGTQNPVFLIDEIDKLAGHGHGGDPASALLEILDPEQNKEFLDHYLDLPYDCSEILFITTANSLESIPHALLDRMEVISLAGYTEAEKLHIARDYLIPRALRRNALKANQLKFHDKALKYLIQCYAREAGVRNLEKQISRICRRVAYRVALGTHKPLVIKDSASIEKFLGAPVYTSEMTPHTAVPGLVTGLAWTSHGGDVLYIESACMEGKGGLTLTGQLGDVMKESANIAYSLVRERTRELGLPADFFDKHLLHLHVPAGATPKDGPSAGITMAVSLYSLLSKKVVRKDVAMTGEVTLTGRVLAVGGIKEKLLAAKRAGMKTVLLPAANEKDLREIEPAVKAGLQIVKVATLQDVLRVIEKVGRKGA